MKRFDGRFCFGGYLSSQRVRPFKPMTGTMRLHMYRNVLIHQARSNLKKQKLGHFQHDNDLKLTAKSAKEYVYGKPYPAHVSELSSKSHDLYTNESLRLALDVNSRKEKKYLYKFIRCFQLLVRCKQSDTQKNAKEHSEVST